MVVRVGQKRRVGRVWFREWREHRNMTLEQVAEAVGAGRSAIQKIESGETKYNQSSLEALAEALQTTPAALVAGPPKPDQAQAVAPEVAKAIDVLMAAGFGKR